MAGESASGRSRSLWKWYFIVIIALTLLATGSLWWFNWSIQLTPEDLAAHRGAWEQKQPRRYRFSYLRVADDADTGRLYRVEVVDRKVLRAEEFEVAVRDRTEVESFGTGRILDGAEAARHSIEGLFDVAKALMDEDAKLGRRVYVRARFHSDHGALLDFVHRVMRSRQRLQLSILSFKDE